ncbi:hypothetical protein FH972_021965 [Carpinus fangiana]|uniref:Uncharacterized protein n=1 Tax=Carpinus fangiana TaxID=176857 RepID=A0A5N6KRF4_9ROSI|nr:hypothetical protein FH972_021965 [Carpinus fangiana]
MAIGDLWATFSTHVLRSDSIKAKRRLQKKRNSRQTAPQPSTPSLANTPFPSRTHAEEEAQPISRTSSQATAVKHATKDSHSARSDASLVTALDSVFDTHLHSVPDSASTRRSSTSSLRSLHQMPSIKRRTFKRSKTPAPDEVDTACVQIVGTPAFKASLRSSPPSIALQPLNSHPTQPTLDLFYPALFQSVALCDPKIHGSPVQLRSANFQIGASALHVGNCDFLNLASNDSEHCVISTRGGYAGDRPRFYLEYPIAIWTLQTPSAPSQHISCRTSATPAAAYPSAPTNPGATQAST